MGDNVQWSYLEVVVQMKCLLIHCRGSVHCTLYTVHCTLYTVHIQHVLGRCMSYITSSGDICTVYTVQFTVTSAHCTVYNNNVYIANKDIYNIKTTYIVNNVIQ